MKRHALPFLLAPWLLACAASPAPVPASPVVAEAAPVAKAPEPEAPAKPAEPIYSPFSTQTLTSLLTAELAAHRQRPDITLQNYLAEAEATRDIGVISRATTIAQVLNRPESLSLSKLWTEVAPEAADAWYLLSLNSLRQLRFDLAIPALNQLINLQPEADLEQLFLAVIPALPEARNTLYSKLDTLAQNHPDNANLRFGQALLMMQNGKPAEALALAQQARKLRPSISQATLLEARLLTEQGQSKAAASLLGEAVAQKPDSQNLRLNYARTLVQAGDNKTAQKEFQTLVNAFPDNDALRLSLALIAFDNHDDAVAQHELETLRNNESLRNEALYYIGQLAQRQNRPVDALSAYESILPSNKYLPAQAEITRLLFTENQQTEARQRLAQARAQLPDIAVPLFQLEAELLNENGQTSDSISLLNTALTEYPEDPNLLLSRAMTAEKRGELDAFEADIRRVLRTDPDNPSALNALGYTLADRTERYSEAEAYIRRAHEIRPDDPAIIDSLGWVKFKLGDRDGALTDLRRAYALFPDDEVAAHLGEVLWALGEKDEARRIWTETLRQHPDSKHIPRTRERLDSRVP